MDKKKYWLRGGIIGMAIFVLLITTVGIVNKINGTSECGTVFCTGTFLDLFVSEICINFLLPIYYVLSLFARIFVRLPDSLFNTIEPVMSIFGSMLGGLAVYFIVGA